MYFQWRIFNEIFLIQYFLYFQFSIWNSVFCNTVFSLWYFQYCIFYTVFLILYSQSMKNFQWSIFNEVSSMQYFQCSIFIVVFSILYFMFNILTYCLITFCMGFLKFILCIHKLCALCGYRIVFFNCRWNLAAAMFSFGIAPIRLLVTWAAHIWSSAVITRLFTAVLHECSLYAIIPFQLFLIKA